jgi:phage terminase small subunit
MPVRDKINDKQKIFVDLQFTRGLSQTEAYVQAYGITNRIYANNGSCRLMKNPIVKAYYDHKHEEYRKTLNIDKDKMLDMLMDELNLFNEMKVLANKDTLTEIEQSRFSRLASLLKASDANKTRDMINKLIGSYEAEKHDVTHNVWNVGFATPLQKEEKEEDE